MTSRLRKLGLAAHIIFSVGWLGCERIGEGLEAHFSWNYTAVLDCAAITWAGSGSFTCDNKRGGRHN